MKSYILIGIIDSFTTKNQVLNLRCSIRGPFLLLFEQVLRRSFNLAA